MPCGLHTALITLLPISTDPGSLADRYRGPEFPSSDTLLEAPRHPRFSRSRGAQQPCEWFTCSRALYTSQAGSSAWRSWTARPMCPLRRLHGLRQCPVSFQQRRSDAGCPQLPPPVAACRRLPSARRRSKHARPALRQGGQAQGHVAGGEAVHHAGPAARGRRRRVGAQGTQAVAGAAACIAGAAVRARWMLSSAPALLSLAAQDLEKAGAKRGVVLQSVKDVLQVGAAAQQPWRGPTRPPPAADAPPIAAADPARPPNMTCLLSACRPCSRWWTTTCATWRRSASGAPRRQPRAGRRRRAQPPRHAWSAARARACCPLMHAVPVSRTRPTPPAQQLLLELPLGARGGAGEPDTAAGAPPAGARQCGAVGARCRGAPALLPLPAERPCT